MRLPISEKRNVLFSERVALLEWAGPGRGQRWKDRHLASPVPNFLEGPLLVRFLNFRIFFYFRIFIFVLSGEYYPAMGIPRAKLHSENLARGGSSEHIEVCVINQLISIFMCLM